MKNFLKKMLIVLVGILIILVVFLSFTHNSNTDRINPMIKEETSYAEVPLNTNEYRNVEAFDSNGNHLKYKINEIGGYDSTKKYISFVHKGQYVKSISYISKAEFNKIKK